MNFIMHFHLKYKLRTFLIFVSILPVLTFPVQYILQFHERKLREETIQQLNQLDVGIVFESELNFPDGIQNTDLKGDSKVHSIVSVYPVDDDALNLIVRFEEIQKLHLENAHLTENGLSLLTRLTSLRHLNLSNLQLKKKEGFSVLANLNSIEELYLDGASVSDETIQLLPSLLNLRTLSLRSTAITDNIVPSLEKCHSLEKVYLDNTKFSLKGARKLNALKPKCLIVFSIGKYVTAFP